MCGHTASPANSSPPLPRFSFAWHRHSGPARPECCFLFDRVGFVKRLLADRLGLESEVAHFSFGARVGAECSWELPRLLNSMQGRQAARRQRELAEAGSGRRGTAGVGALGGGGKARG